jgi:hypothetical protein
LEKDIKENDPLIKDIIKNGKVLIWYLKKVR